MKTVNLLKAHIDLMKTLQKSLQKKSLEKLKQISKQTKKYPKLIKNNKQKHPEQSTILVKLLACQT